VAPTQFLERMAPAQVGALEFWEASAVERSGLLAQQVLLALEREWEENDIAQYVAVIAGQEMGKKAEHICLANDGEIDGKGGVVKKGSRYASDHILMIGDAPGDMKAARENDALFFPINPGEEEKSWELFFNEAADKFFDGTYAGGYEAQLIEDFHKRLPDTPPWKK
jgi:hypothetical protein